MVQMAPKGGKIYFFNKYGATSLRFSSRRHEPTEYPKTVLESYQHVLTLPRKKPVRPIKNKKL